MVLDTFQRSHKPFGCRVMDYMLRLGAFPAKNPIGMQDVFTKRHYFQVVYSVVSLNSIAVIHRHPIRNRTNESLCHKLVKGVAAFLVIYAERYQGISPEIGVGAERMKPPISSIGPDIPQIANFISRKAFYCLPNFARIVFRHLDTFLSRCLEPFAALERCNGSLISYQLDSKVAIWGT